jgi:hypothetical protein
MIFPLLLRPATSNSRATLKNGININWFGGKDGKASAADVKCSDTILPPAHILP